MMHWSYCIASALIGAAIMLLLIACADSAKTADKHLPNPNRRDSHV